MKKIIFFCALGLSAVLSAQTSTVGSGNALDFSANISNANHVDLGPLTAINNADFTVECWMKVNAVMDDEAFFSNKSWASGSNVGMVFDVQGAGNDMKFNFKDATHTRKDLAVSVGETSRDWYHFAGTYTKNGYFRVYINGVIKDSLNVSTLTASFASSYTYKLGQDGTGNYSYGGANPRFNGKIDEVRIWTAVRTAQEIRDNMCKKLSGTETNLYAYYNCDQTTGTALTDLTGVNTATLVNSTAANWAMSSAPIGNASIASYTTNFGTSTVQLTDAAYGNFSVKNITGTKGIHVYQVNAQPSFTNGLNNLAGNNNYFGVFVTDTASSITYDAEYNYTNFAAAIGDEANLELFNRVKNEGSVWSNCQATQDLTLNTMTKTGLNTRREFVLGTNAGSGCNAPSALAMTGNSPGTATIDWTTGGSTAWNIQWGAHGFALGTGTTVLNSAKPKTFTGLTSLASYDVYVQDTCLGSGKSYWVGPLTFSAGVCQAPLSLTAGSITNTSAALSWSLTAPASYSFDIEWGLPGFTPGAGIPVTGVANPYTLNGLGINTAYSYYVRTACSANDKSMYSGPYTFTTTNNTTGINESSADNSLQIYPNPTRGQFTVSQEAKAQGAVISIVDVLGSTVAETRLHDGAAVHATFDLGNIARGFYVVRIRNAGSMALKKIVLN